VTDSTTSIAVRGDAPESLIRPIRAIPLRLGALGGGFYDEIQKNFLRRILNDRDVVSRLRSAVERA
jgi:hypothetical protein